MKLDELSNILELEQIAHKYDEKAKRLYISAIPNFTVFLEELDNHYLFLRVWKKWNKDNPLTKQEQKDMNGCKMVKFKVLKKLHQLNEKSANKQMYIEDMPASPESVKLFPVDESKKSILDIDL